MNFSGCDCLKKFLCANGYDDALSLKLITNDGLNESENYIDANRESFLNSLSCKHAKIYKEQKVFKILGGHRYVALKWSAQISSDEKTKEEEQKFTIKHPAFSPILRDIISSALYNYNREPQGRAYSDLLWDFSKYIFILGGKASYEIISSNVPLPKAGTMCKNWDLLCKFDVYLN